MDGGSLEAYRWLDSDLKYIRIRTKDILYLKTGRNKLSVENKHIWCALL
jgi:hypothetical protein